MILKIHIPTDYLCIPCKDAGPLLASLEQSFMVKSEGWGKDQKWVKQDDDQRLSLEFIAESTLVEKPEPLKKALEDYESATSRWLASYQEGQLLKKERDELKKQIEEIKAKVSP